MLCDAPNCDMVAFKVTDTENISKGSGTVPKDPLVHSPVTFHTKKRNYEWIMLPSDGKMCPSRNIRENFIQLII